MDNRRVLDSHGAKSLKVALGLLNARGFGTADCLRGTGVSPDDLDSPDARVSLAQEFIFYRNVLALTGDPLIGLDIGREYHLPNYGIWGYAVMSAPNLGAALRLAFRFIALTYTCHDISLRETSRSAAMRLVPLRDYEDCLQVITDRDTSTLRLIVGELLGRELPLEQVDLIHAGEEHRSRYEDFFGCKVRFGSSWSELRISPSLLEVALPQSDPRTTRLSEHQCELLLSSLDRDRRILDDVRQLLLETPGRFPGFEDAAARLALSPRTLRRLLREAGSSYSEVLNDLRYQLARQYLEATPLSVKEIARILGYGDPGNFTHAFKRWSGESPNAYRTRPSKHRS